MSALDLAESVGKVNTVFKLGSDGAAQLSSAFDKLADSGLSSFSSIANVVSRISGTAVAAGLTAQETTVLAAALLDTGTHAELGSTSLSRLIQSLNDVEAHATFGKVLGVGAEEFAAKVKASPMSAIREFLAALSQLGAGEQMVALKGIGIEGVQGAGEIQKLATQAGVLGEKLDITNNEFLTLSQTNKSYAQTASQTGSALTQMQNRFQIMSDTIGTSLLPVITAIGEAFGSLADRVTAAFSGNSEGIGGFAEVIKNLPLAFDVASLQIAGYLVAIGEHFQYLGDSAVATWEYIRETGAAVFGFLGDIIGGVFGRVLATIRNTFGMAEAAMTNILTANVGDVFKGEFDLFRGFDVDKARAESSLVDMKLPEFRMPSLKMPEMDRTASGIIREQIADKLHGGAQLAPSIPPLAVPRPAPMPLAERFGMLEPGSLSPSARAALGIGDPFVQAAAAGRMALSPREKVARNRAAKAAKAAARRAELARGRGKGGKGAAKDEKLKALEEGNAAAGKQVEVSERMLKALERGMVGRLA
jgi:TP901 family phage tail tape measure protein